ncbi:MAG: ribonuclease E/G, partial [Actinomycetota bacterium]
MASNEDHTSNQRPNMSASGSADPGQDLAVPVKKAAAKRAPRKATKKASTPKKAPPVQIADVHGAPAEADAPLDEATAASEPATLKTPARKAAKRAPRKAAKKASAVPPLDGAQPAPSPELASEPVAEQVAGQTTTPAPVIPGFGLIFQAPEVTAPRRRRASAPAAAPEPVQAAPKAPGEQDADATADATDDADDSDSGADGARHRRRRGGKGRRGRAGGEAGAEESGSERNATPEEPAAAPADQPHTDDGAEDEGASHRRTRRRRRGASAESSDDSPSTTTRVREPRPQHDEVTAIKGSTRLEAKKQRRREGRESGRRRTVITEAEFLARRESVERVMVVR